MTYEKRVERRNAAHAKKEKPRKNYGGAAIVPSKESRTEYVSRMIEKKKRQLRDLQLRNTLGFGTGMFGRMDRSLLQLTPLDLSFDVPKGLGKDLRMMQNIAALASENREKLLVAHIIVPNEEEKARVLEALKVYGLTDRVNIVVGGSDLADHIQQAEDRFHRVTPNSAPFYERARIPTEIVESYQDPGRVPDDGGRPPGDEGIQSIESQA